MEINVLNTEFEKIAVVDSYESLIWCKRYNDYGALDLQIEATTETLSIFKRGYYITRDDDDTIFRIEAIELDTNENKNNSLIIGAVDFKKVLNQRIIYSTADFSNVTVESLIRKLITDNFISPTDSNRTIPIVLTDPKGFQETITAQITYENVGEKISELCKTYNYGYRIYCEKKVLYFDLFRGLDRSINQKENLQIVFSPKYDNLISSKYTMNIDNVKNVALVGGEGEGKNRKLKEVGTSSGLNRIEMFVDASSLSTNDGEIPLATYYETLVEKGKEELTKNSVSTSFEGTVDTELYKYKTDFDLGDIVTLENEYGISVDARIVEIIETWNETGYSIEPRFEYMEVLEMPDVTNAILTENAVALMSENSVVLLSETAAASTGGVKISELEVASELYDGCCLPIVQDGKTKKVYFETIKNQCNSEVESALENKAEKTEVENALSNKVDKITGKGLSTNDFTNDYKNKIDNFSATGLQLDLLWRGTSSTSASVLNLAHSYTDYTFILVEACMYSNNLAQRQYMLIPSSQCSLQTASSNDDFKFEGSISGTIRSLRFKFPTAYSLAKLASEGTASHLPVITNVWGIK